MKIPRWLLKQFSGQGQDRYLKPMRMPRIRYPQESCWSVSTPELECMQSFRRQAHADKRRGVPTSEHLFVIDCTPQLFDSCAFRSIWR